MRETLDCESDVLNTRLHYLPASKGLSDQDGKKKTGSSNLQAFLSNRNVFGFTTINW